MRIHYLQHVPYEGIGNIEHWIRRHDHQLSATRLYAGEELPDPAAFEFLIVMGGPMGVHDQAAHPWLVPEQSFIRSVVANGCTVLGICLGAQLISASLGGAVTRNRFREIGWFPIVRSGELEASTHARLLPPELLVLHWHGDTFTIPDGALRLAGSAACANQGFLLGERVLGLQFHLESTAQDVGEMIAHSLPDAPDEPYIQSAAELLANPDRFAAVEGVMHGMLDYLAAAV